MCRYDYLFIAGCLFCLFGRADTNCIALVIFAIFVSNLLSGYFNDNYQSSTLGIMLTAIVATSVWFFDVSFPFKALTLVNYLFYSCYAFEVRRNV